MLFSFPLMDQTNYKHIVMINKEGSTKIVNFMTPGPGVLVLRRGHILVIQISGYVLSCTLSIYTCIAH